MIIVMRVQLIFQHVPCSISCVAPLSIQLSSLSNSCFACTQIPSHPHPHTGPASLSTDLSAAYHLLATRICPDASSSSVRGVSGRDRSAAETPLAKSLLAVRDPQELTSK